MAFNQLFTNINLHSNTKPQLTVDEVEKVQRQRITSLVGHVFQLTYATIFDALIQQERVNRFNGCAIHHPSHREHSCLMMDSEDGWFYYHDDVRDKIDLNEVYKTLKVYAVRLVSSWGSREKGMWLSYQSHLGPVFTLLPLNWIALVKLSNRNNCNSEFCTLFTTGPVD